MAEIIEFLEELKKRDGLSINKSKDEIKIETKKGKIYIELSDDALDLHASVKSNDEDDTQKVSEISEEECKSILRMYFELITFQSPIESLFENLWNEIKNEILNTQNFRFGIVLGNLLCTKSQSTFILSSIYSIKK